MTSKKARLSYIEGDAYKYWQRLLDIIDEHLLPYYVVGSKGVGKSSLLSALFEYIKGRENVQAHYYIEPTLLTAENAERLFQSFMSNERVFLFIDNIELLPKCNKDVYDRVLHLLKNKIRNMDFFILCATSRQGLRVLKTELGISLDDLMMQMYVVNPDERVCRKMMESALEALTVNKPYWIEKSTELLDHVGYVPRLVHLLAFYMKSNLKIEKIYSSLSGIIKDMIKRDCTNLEDQYKSLYYRCLAIVSRGYFVNLDDIDLNPVDVPWTFLKAERVSDDPEVVTRVGAVSRLVQQSVNEFISEDEAGLVNHLQARYDICRREDKEETIVSILEMMVLHALKLNPVIKYIYYHSDAFVHGQLSLEDNYLGRVDRRNESVVHSSFYEGKTSCAYYFPNAKSFDFIVFDKMGTSHAIQVTSKCDWQAKCRKSEFLEETGPSHKYILTPNTPHIDELSQMTSYFLTAVTQCDLRVIDPTFIKNIELLKILCQFK